jgi:tRNA pseudouridine38-40 synthase
VHAWGQVVHFDATPDLGEKRSADAPLSGTRTVGEPLDALQRSLNKMLAPAIVVRAAEVAAPGFDARRSAIGRRYRYTVLNRAVPDPFLAPTSWLVEQPLDLRAMQLACDPLLGEHDFSSFCRRPPDKAADEPLTRVVREAGWRDLGDGVLRFEIAASAFCHQMVRSVVGMLVGVGRGKLRAGDVSSIIRSRDRHQAGHPAPAQGLCLWEVMYPESQTATVPADQEEAANGGTTQPRPEGTHGAR